MNDKYTNSLTLYTKYVHPRYEYSVKYRKQNVLIKLSVYYIFLKKLNSFFTQQQTIIAIVMFHHSERFSIYHLFLCDLWTIPRCFLSETFQRGYKTLRPLNDKFFCHTVFLNSLYSLFTHIYWLCRLWLRLTDSLTNREVKWCTSLCTYNNGFNCNWNNSPKWKYFKWNAWIHVITFYVFWYLNTRVVGPGGDTASTCFIVSQLIMRHFSRRFTMSFTNDSLLNRLPKICKHLPHNTSEQAFIRCGEHWTSGMLFYVFV